LLLVLNNPAPITAAPPVAKPPLINERRFSERDSIPLCLFIVAILIFCSY